MSQFIKISNTQIRPKKVSRKPKKVSRKPKITLNYWAVPDILQNLIR